MPFPARLTALPCLCLFLLAAPLAAGEIALSFDDAPRYDTHHFSGQARTDTLLARLREADVPRVVFFAVTVKFDRDGGAARMAQYAAAGHLVGNHTHAHPWIHEVGAPAYIEGIKTAHERLKDHPGFRPWFRYPFLDQGRSRDDQTAIAAALRDMGYAHGYVTVDNYDWYMDHLYQQGLRAGRTPDMAALKDVYIEVLWRCIQFYDKLARDTLGRSPKHMLLLHENDLAALFVDDLVAFLRAQGWSIISPEEAYADPIAEMLPTGKCRQGRVACLARETGYQGMVGDDSEDEAFLEALFAERKIFHEAPVSTHPD